MPSLFPAPSPELPEDFGSLLVQGNYHASAPIHLAMSFLAQRKDATAMIVTPSRNLLVQALQKYQDDWIRTNRSRGDIFTLSSRIKLFYPPSPAHLAYLMMISSVPDASTAGTSAWVNGKTTFTKAPALLILHEVSSYFSQEQELYTDRPADEHRPRNASWTVASYVSLVAHSLSFLTKPGKTTIDRAFALFDSGLCDLRLPMLRQSETDLRLEKVSTYVEKYFYWFIEASNEDEAGQKTMLVYQHGQPPDQAQKWTFREHVEDNGDVQNASTHILCQ